MPPRFEGFATGVLVLAAVSVAAASVHREFGSSGSQTVGATAMTPPAFVKDWQDLIKVGTLIGDSAAPVKIIEFSDIECPGCKMFFERTNALPISLRSKVAVVFVHFPLSMHRFATPAARAAECARAEDKFAPVLAMLFQGQDSLGLKSWISYASDAGIRDTARFATCVASSESVPLIEAGRAVGNKLGINGTPTVIINGWRYSSPPYDSLAALVRRFASNPAP
jgi:protein-disulfide isomerase